MGPKILIVSYLFPPVGGIAVQRALSLAKYLPRCGYEVHILKAKNAAGPGNDPSLARKVPPEVHVHEAFTPEIPFAIRHKLWGRIAGGAGKPGPAAAAKPAGWKVLAKRAMARVFCPEPEIF